MEELRPEGLDVYDCPDDTHEESAMRTNIVVDDALMAGAQDLAGMKTKKETVEQALRLLISVKKQAHMRKYRGRLTWEGDLDRMRTDR